MPGLPAMPRPRTRTLRLASRDLFGLLVVLAWAAIAVVFHEEFYDYYAVLSSVVILAGAVSFYRWDPAPGREGYRLLGFFVCGQAFISSGVSVLNRVDVNPLLSTPTEEAFSAAVESTVIFAFMFLLGALLTAPRSGQALADAPTPTAGPTRLVALVVATITSLLTISLLRSDTGQLGTLPFIFFNIGIIGPMLIAQESLTGKRNRLALGILLLGQAITVFYTSMLGVLFLPLRDLLMARIYLKRPLPLLFIAGLIGVFVLLNPVKHLFRAETARSDDADGAGQTYARWSDAFSTTWSDDSKSQRSRKTGLEESSSRLDYNWISAHVFRTVPRRLPFEEGETYVPIATILIPRVIYPDKPNSAEYGRGKWMVKLGVQSRQATRTASFALPTSAEAFWNFGWPGVFLVPTLLGAFVGLMLRWGPKDPVVRAGYVVLLASNLGQFLDMMIWIIPAFVTVGASAIFAALYNRFGKTALKASKAQPVMRAPEAAPLAAE